MVCRIDRPWERLLNWTKAAAALEHTAEVIGIVSTPTTDCTTRIAWYHLSLAT